MISGIIPHAADHNGETFDMYSYGAKVFAGIHTCIVQCPINRSQTMTGEVYVPRSLDY